MNRSYFSRFLPFLPMVLVWCGFAWATRTICTDDSYIFLTYSKHIAMGDGYVFNLGERINGTTSPLYTLIAALLYVPFTHFLPAALPLLGHAVGMLCLLSTIALLAYSLTLDHLKAAGMIAPIFFLANRGIYAAVGMETFLTLALMLASVVLYQKNRLTAASVFSALAVLSRPDAILLSALLPAHFVITKRKLPPLRAALAFGLTLLPWILFSYFYFGTVVPNTLSAKLAQSENGFWGGGFLFFTGAVKALQQSYGILSAVSIALAFIILCVRFRSVQSKPGLILISTWGIIYFLVYSFALNPPAYAWYFTPFALVISVWLASAADLLLGSFGKIRVPALILLASLVLVRAGALVVSQSRRPATAKYDLYTRAAAWLNTNAPAGSSVASYEVGILGYFYERGKIIDPLGLITPGAADYVRRGENDWYVRKLRPDFLVVKKPPRYKLEDFTAAAWFKEQYTRRVDISLHGRNGLRIYSANK